MSRYEEDESIAEFTSDEEFDAKRESDNDQLDEIKASLNSKNDNRLILWSRIFLVAVILLSSALVAYLTHYFLSEDENEDFENSFRFHSDEIVRVVNEKTQDVFSQLKILSNVFAATAASANASWPNVTLVDFEIFGSKTLKLTGASMVAFSPLVEEEQRRGWESYSGENQSWMKQGGDVQAEPIRAYIHEGHGQPSEPEDKVPYSPIWQLSPPPTDTSFINFNLLHHPTFKRLYQYSLVTRSAAKSEVLDASELFGSSGQQMENDTQSILVQPIFIDAANVESDIVGFVTAVIPWSVMFRNILPETAGGIYCVFRESCGGNFTYILDGSEARFLGTGDFHDFKYNRLRVSESIRTSDGNATSISGFGDDCYYKLDIYPSSISKDEATTSRPMIFTFGVLVVFAFVSTIFLLYDWLVGRRQRKIFHNAMRSSAIVADLFPAQVRADLERVHEAKIRRHEAAKSMKRAGNRLGQFSTGETEAVRAGDDIVDDKPIADFFPECTVLFADIAGFTAWSSVREPAQVFVLLETVYKAFDKIASLRGVYKVETIGDCYLAVCGLPEARHDHAVVMARFARDITKKMNELTGKLEARLGLGTTDLALRIGLHSGSVTAGIVRGDRARFQLFGDTVNTASRMESNGMKAKIQVSLECAELLRKAGKSHWLVERDDKISAKGKGELQTFWLSPKAQGTKNSTTDSNSNSDTTSDTLSNAGNTAEKEELQQMCAGMSTHQERLVQWNSDTLEHHLRLVVAKRSRMKRLHHREDCIQSMSADIGHLNEGFTVIDEVSKTVHLPEYDSLADVTNEQPAFLSKEVVKQLRMFVATVSSLYHANEFHNFDHASHVTMSAVKLLARIVTPTLLTKDTPESHVKANTFDAEILHEHSLGISSDPLTQFAVIFSTLIHDLDHRGVPNFVLSREDQALSQYYGGRSIAEQNSFDIAWNLLQDRSYDELRKEIFGNEDEIRRFRQVVINCVMATDIFDEDSRKERDNRWKAAFCGEEAGEEGNRKMLRNQKAMLALEQLIQICDVSHTMQHWHVYTKWNERLYREFYVAFATGRTDTDPTGGWYEGEMSFFDNYVIPLALKSKECAVFGVSSEEFLGYAMTNRKQWEIQGRDLVAAYQQRAHDSFSN